MGYCAGQEDVQCPACGNVQPDMGAHMQCEECGFAPMPFCDEDGNLIED
jgi:hypothetical protein